MSGRIGQKQREILRKMDRGWTLKQDENGAFYVSPEGRAGFRLAVPARSCLALWERGYIMRDEGWKYALTEQGKAAIKETI